ncbi:unnamed protein product [Gadus morhua 'NCC']
MEVGEDVEVVVMQVVEVVEVVEVVVEGVVVIVVEEEVEVLLLVVEELVVVEVVPGVLMCFLLTGPLCPGPRPHWTSRNRASPDPRPARTPASLDQPDPRFPRPRPNRTLASPLPLDGPVSRLNLQDGSERGEAPGCFGERECTAESF